MAPGNAERGGPEANISRTAVGRPATKPGTLSPAPDITVPPAPPKKEKQGGHSGIVTAIEAGATAAAVVIAGAVAIDRLATGQFPWEQLPGAGPATSGKTPEPINRESPTVTLPAKTTSPISEPTPTLEATPTLSPTPEPTPTPSPEPTKTPLIEQVPVNKLGRAEMRAYGQPPFFNLNLMTPTVVAVEPIKNGEFWFAVTLPGNKVQKTSCYSTIVASDWINQHMKGESPTVELCSWKGTTLWIEVGKKTILGSAADSLSIIGRGPEIIRESIHVGEAIPGIGIAFTDEQGMLATKAQNKMNNNSFQKLENSIGQSFARTDRRFSFFAGVIYTSPQ